MSIRKLAADAEFSPVTKVTGKIVAITRTVKTDKDAKFRYELTCSLDFGTCSAEEILELATRSAWIDIQRQWRELAGTKGSTATTVNPFAKVNVKTAIVDATRKSGPRDPKVTAANALAKLSPAERAALIAQFAQMQPELIKKSA